MDETNSTNPSSEPHPPEPIPKEYVRTLQSDLHKLRGDADPTPVPAPVPAATPKEEAPKVAPPPVVPLQIVPLTPADMPTPVLEKTVPQAPSGALETYSGDFTERVQRTRASTATVLAAEQDARVEPPNLYIPKTVQPLTIVYIIAGFALVICGIAGTYIAMVKYAATQVPIIAHLPPSTSPIAVDEQVALVGDSGAQLLQSFAASVTTQLNPGAIRLLYTTNSIEASTTPVSVFAQIATSSAPNVLVRNVNASGSIAGVDNVQGEQSAFFILSVASYDDTFSGMLAWEPRMRADLAEIFPPYPVGTSTKPIGRTASTTATRPVVLPTFYDTTVANHDVRIYRDAAGNTIMLYGYWNQTTLVIARDQAAFTDLVQRLATARPGS